jgi:ATP-dependent Clp protease ATP-binding subunit ClpA
VHQHSDTLPSPRCRQRGTGLRRILNAIQVAPTSEEDAIKALHGIKGVYEGFHNVSYSDDAITHAVFYTRNGITNRSLPSSAVDVIDEAGH